MLRHAVFLDRDDTINRNADLPDGAWGDGTPGDLLDADFVELLPGVLEACRRLKRAGYAIVVITNQGGIARGGGDIDDLDRCNDVLRDLLPADPPDDQPGPSPSIPSPLRPSLIDAFYACPFHPAGAVTHFADEHDWRKPNPGMITAACNELGLDPKRSWMVGDKQRDLDAARAAGIPHDRCLMISPNQPTPDLTAAADLILGPADPSDSPPDDAPVVATRVTLTARTGDPAPLADTRVRDTVLATARAIAERTGIDLLELEADDRSITAIIAAGRIPAMGFMSELRRLSNAWHHGKAGTNLWPQRDDD